MKTLRSPFIAARKTIQRASSKRSHLLPIICRLNKSYVLNVNRRAIWWSATHFSTARLFKHNTHSFRITNIGRREAWEPQSKAAEHTTKTAKRKRLVLQLTHSLSSYSRYFPVCHTWPTHIRIQVQFLNLNKLNYLYDNLWFFCKAK